MPNYQLKRKPYREIHSRKSPMFESKKRKFSEITEKSSSSSEEEDRPQSLFRTPPPVLKLEIIDEKHEEHHRASGNGGNSCNESSTSQSSKLIEVEIDYLKEILSLLKQQDAAIKQLVQKESLQQVTLMKLGETVQQIKRQILKNQPEQPEDDQEYNIFAILEKLPASCQDDLHLLEEFLSNNEHMNRTVKKIASLGGNSIYEFIVRATQKLITNSCGAEYSYLGRKLKKPFIELQLWHLLLRSAKIVFPTSTEKEVEEQISKWLRRCAERVRTKKDVPT